MFRQVSNQPKQTGFWTVGHTTEPGKNFSFRLVLQKLDGSEPEPGMYL